MCLVYLKFDPNSDYPVMIGANREESRKRPFAEPCFDVDLTGGKYTHMKYVAGQDRGMNGDFETIGTWLGFTKHGLAVAVTNRDDGILKGAEKIHSRGVLCHELLDCVTAIEAKDVAAKTLMEGRYGGSNYLIADKATAWIVHSPGPQVVEAKQLEIGLHVLTNLDINDPNDIRIQFIKSKTTETPEEFLESAKNCLSSKEIIVNDEEWGTISSSILLIPKETDFDFWRKIQFWHSDSKPLDSSYYNQRLPINVSQIKVSQIKVSQIKV